MSSIPIKAISARAAQLRARVAGQRRELAQEFALVEQRFHAIDNTLRGVSNVFIKPPFIVGSVAMWLLGRRRSKHRKQRDSHERKAGRISRALFWIATARRLYRMFKNR